MLTIASAEELKEKFLDTIKSIKRDDIDRLELMRVRKQQYQIRKYQKNDEEKIVQLLNLVFNGWPLFDIHCTNVDYWKWKFLDNPLNLTFSALCLEGHNVIGCHHAIPQKIKIGNETHLYVAAVDFAVHPDHRRKGISKRVSQLNGSTEKEAGVRFSFWASRNPIIIKNALRARSLRFPHKILHLINIINIENHLIQSPVKNKMLIKIGYQTVKTWNSLRKLTRRKPSIKSDIKIVRIDKFDGRINEFWDEVSREYAFIVERRREYLNWRYCDKRGGNYLINLAEEDGKIIGYTVSRINKFQQDYPIGYIVDMLTLPNRLDAAKALLEQATNYLFKEGVNIINCLVIKNHPYEELYRINGFLDSRTDMYLFHGSYEGLSLESLESQPGYKVHYVYGDIDTI